MPANVETMAFAHEVPWHKLGVQVDENISAEQMMVAAGCDWEVRKFDTYCLTGPQGKAGTTKVKTGQQALLRVDTNTVLSPNVGPGWQPTQNQEAFDFFHDFVEAGQMTMETAGSLFGGEIVWAMAKINETFEPVKGDVVNPYLFFSNSHRYGESTKVDYSAVRIVCANTWNAALKSKSENRVTVSHRAAFDPEKVKEMMGLAKMRTEQFSEAAKALASVRCKDDEALEFFQEIFPVISKKGPAKKEVSKLASQAMLAHHNAPGLEFATGTWWHAFNTTTYMVDHVLCRTEDRRFYEAMLGMTREMKNKALKLALEKV